MGFIESMKQRTTRLKEKASSLKERTGELRQELREEAAARREAKYSRKEADYERRQQLLQKQQGYLRAKAGVAEEQARLGRLRSQRAQQIGSVFGFGLQTPNGKRNREGVGQFSALNDFISGKKATTERPRKRRPRYRYVRVRD